MRNSVEITEGPRDCQKMGSSQVSANQLRHFLITGRVQGVGFRRFVQSAGQSLGLAGSVRNLEDGRVEALALADREKMNAFEKQLATGPAGSKVTDIVAVDREARHDLNELLAKNFAVQPDGRKEWF